MCDKEGFKFAFSFTPSSGDVEGNQEAMESTDTSSADVVACEGDYEIHPPIALALTSSTWKDLRTPGGLSFRVVDTNTKARGNSNINAVIDGLPEDTDLISGKCHVDLTNTSSHLSV